MAWGSRFSTALQVTLCVQLGLKTTDVKERNENPSLLGSSSSQGPIDAFPLERRVGALDKHLTWPLQKSELRKQGWTFEVPIISLVVGWRSEHNRGLISKTTMASYFWTAECHNGRWWLQKKENRMTLDNNVRCTGGLSYDCSNGGNSADPENPAKRGKQGIITIPRRDKRRSQELEPKRTQQREMSRVSGMTGKCLASVTEVGHLT